MTALRQVAADCPHRHALRDICQSADILELPEGTFLLVKATPTLIDFLAEFEAEREDLEPSLGSTECKTRTLGIPRDRFGDQTFWGHGGTADAEDEHDGREEDESL